MAACVRAPPNEPEILTDFAGEIGNPSPISSSANPVQPSVAFLAHLVIYLLPEVSKLFLADWTRDQCYRTEAIPWAQSEFFAPIPCSLLRHPFTDSERSRTRSRFRQLRRIQGWLLYLAGSTGVQQWRPSSNRARLAAPPARNSGIV